MDARGKGDVGRTLAQRTNSGRSARQPLLTLTIGTGPNVTVAETETFNEHVQGGTIHSASLRELTQWIRVCSSGLQPSCRLPLRNKLTREHLAPLHFEVVINIKIQSLAPLALYFSRTCHQELGSPFAER
jgi:hypothetical protein